MKTIKKRFFSIFLSLCMIISCMPGLCVTSSAISRYSIAFLDADHENSNFRTEYTNELPFTINKAYLFSYYCSACGGNIMMYGTMSDANELLSISDNGSISINFTYSNTGDTDTAHISVVITDNGASDTHTITFNSNGGTPVAAITDIEDGENVEAPANPTREGWNFRDWYTDAACTIWYDFGSAVTSSFTLYAMWERHVAEKAATCTEAGNIEYWQRNDKCSSNNDFTDEITLAATVIPALGHNFENGTCTRCGVADPDYVTPNQETPIIVTPNQETPIIVTPPVTPPVNPPKTEDKDEDKDEEEPPESDYDAVVTLSQTEFTYTGEPCTPSFTVTNKKTGKLVPLSCYKAEYKDNTAVGTASLVLTMSAPYSGTVTANFTIKDPEAKEIAGITLSHTSYVFADKTVYCPKVTVTDKEGGVVSEAYYTAEYKDNAAVGTATVTVTMKKPYKGTFTEKFEIVAPSEVGEITLSETEYVYEKGGKYTPSVTVFDKNGATIPSSLYKVTYSSNSAVGTAKVRVIMYKPYSGTYDRYFAIIDGNTVQADKVIMGRKFAYTGKAIKPDVTVVDKNGNVIYNSYYSVKYDKRKDVGTATVTITMKKPYGGVFEEHFEIVDAEPGEIKSVSLPQTTYEYTGKPISPVVIVTDVNDNCVPSAYYSVSYRGNTTEGTAWALVKLKKPYDTNKSYTLYYDIIKPDVVQPEKVVLERTEYVYTGSKIKPTVTVFDTNGDAIPSNMYKLTYDKNRDVGTDATVTVTMVKPYTGIFTENFKIIASEAKGGEVSVSLANTSYMYTGRAIRPEVIVTEKDGGALVSAKYYTVSYKNVTKVGTGTVTVKMKRPYSGDFTLEFKITARAEVDKVTLSGTSFEYTGNKITPSVTVIDKNGNTISSNCYKVAYKNNVKPGTATATVTMKAPYNTKDKYTLNFDILDPSVVQAEKIVLERTEYVYTGSNITPAVTVLDTNGDAITSDKYKVSYGSCKEVGTGTVTVTMKAPYVGVLTETFDIIESKAAVGGKVKVSLAQTSYVYTGRAIGPEVIVTDENGELISSKYYNVSYKNNTKVGTGTVTVSMKSDYRAAGGFTLDFTITERPEVAEITLSETSFAYTGGKFTPPVTVKDTNGNIISSTYYKVSYKHNNNRGMATVVVSMLKPYSGKYEVYFTIY